MKKFDYDQEIKVGIADLKTANSPKRIITLGLGSCVGIAIFDTKFKVGGLAHIMLPDSTQFSTVTNSFKFADLAVPILIAELKNMGASYSRMRARIAGGAQMFSFADKKRTTLNIGERNINKVKEVLKEQGITLLAEEVGGNIGRTMILDTDTGKVFIRSVGRTLKELQ